MTTTTLVRRTAVGYYRANVAAWRTLRRSVDAWFLLGGMQLAAVLLLVTTGHSGAAMIVAACGVLLLALQRATD